MLEILVFGGSGRLGRRIVQKLRADGVAVIAPTHQEMPVESELLGEYIETTKPSYIINCTAFNGLENCRAAPQTAMNINAVAVGIMADEAFKIGARFIHFSTDYAHPPLDVYGITKLAGEELAMLHGRAAIFRVMSIYDTSDFAGSMSPVKMYRQGMGMKESPIKVLKQVTAPTYCGWIAEVVAAGIFRDVIKEFPGVTELAPIGRMSKLTFGRQAIAKFCGAKDATVVEGFDLPIQRPFVSLFTHTRSGKLLKSLNLDHPSILENLDMAHQVWQIESHVGAEQSAGSSA